MATLDGLVSRTYGALFNGVTQQPPFIRLPSQAELQENLQSKIVNGPGTRPPTEHLAKLQATGVPTGGYFFHAIHRDEDEKYFVIIEDNDIRVFDDAGHEADITAASTAYLDFNPANTSAEELFEAVSVADYTFIVNKEKTVAMTGAAGATRPNEFLIYVTEGQTAHATWEITIGGNTKTAVTSGFSISNPKPEDVVTFMLTATWGGPLLDTTVFTNWTFTRIGRNLIHAEQTGSTGSPEALVKTSCGYSDEIYTTVYKQIQDFADLPPKALNGFVCEVTGQGGDEGDNYWVAYSQGEECWVETVAPGLYNNIDATTMPHTLVRTAKWTGTPGSLKFTFAAATWDARLKGDMETAPNPSFVGNTISDVGFHKNRLFFLSDESTVMSEAGSFFNFYPSTVTTLVESDPIDVAGSNNRVALLDFAVPFAGNLTLFSARGGIQNEITGGESFSAKTVEVNPVGAWSSSEKVRPQQVGNAIYFLVDRGTATGVMEYTLTGDAQTSVDADDITAHIPTYIPGNVRLFTSSVSENMLALVSDDEPGSIFVYSFFFERGEKKMSSWSKWTFGGTDTILSLAFMQSDLFMLIERNEGGGNTSVHLEKIALRTLSDGGLSYRIHRDSLVELTGVFAPGTNLTTWTMPYNQASEGGVYEVIQSAAGWGNNMGRKVPEIDTSVDGVITVEGDYEAYACHIGRVYKATYTFSEPVIELSSGYGAEAQPVTQGRLQLRRWKTIFASAGAFTAFVKTADGDEYEYPYSGVIVGDSIIGPPEPRSGVHEFDVGVKSTDVEIRIETTSFLPFILVGAEWEGFYVSRSGRV